MTWPTKVPNASDLEMKASLPAMEAVTNTYSQHYVKSLQMNSNKFFYGVEPAMVAPSSWNFLMTDEP